MFHSFICSVGDKTQGFTHAISKCSTTELHPQTSVFWNRVPLGSWGLPSTLCGCKLTIPLPRLTHSRIAALCHHTPMRLVSLKYKEETPGGWGDGSWEKCLLCKRSLSLDPLNVGENWTWWYKPVTSSLRRQTDRSGAQWPSWELLVQWEKNEKRSRRAMSVLSASGTISDTH